MPVQFCGYLHYTLILSFCQLFVMFQSLRYSNLFLRFGLAAVFIWFGVDKFINPEYWLNAWIPQNIVSLASKAGISGTDVVYASAIFELLNLMLVVNLLTWLSRNTWLPVQFYICSHYTLILSFCQLLCYDSIAVLL